MSTSIKIARGLADETGRRARRNGISAIRSRVPLVVAQYPGLQRDVRRMKETALANLPDLVARAVDNLAQHGFHVFVARDAAAARDYVLQHISPNSRIIKSKSNQAKEIHLPDALLAAGHTVVETDLGDRINQLMGRRSGHVLAPAISIPPQAIRDTFRKTFGQPDLGESEQELVAAARQHMRPILLDANVGISGANAVTVDGAIVLMENEGNIRAVSSLPAVHFVMAAVTKVVPTLEDGLSVVQAASIFGVGQDFGNYCTVLTGPALAAGPEIHVVLIDDGRLSAREQEPLMCINCGSCLNVCPVFAEIGEEYGGERIGGIGVLQTFVLGHPEQAVRDGLDLCLGCQRCIPACPVAIDTPAITSRLRQRAGSSAMPYVRRQVLHAVISRRALRLARLSLLASERIGLGRALRRRGRRAIDFIPAPGPAPSLGRGVIYPAPSSIRRGRVLFFAGCVMDALYGNIHRDTIYVLNQNGWDVTVPPGQVCCGALHWHAGQSGPVGGLAAQNGAAFRGSDPVVVNSAGCGAFLKEYAHGIVQQDNAGADLAERVFDLSEFLVRTGLRAPHGRLDVTATYHNPCHLAYAQGISREPVDLLSAIPGLVIKPLVEREACCGSAGTFNLEHPDLAWQLARDKADDALTTGAAWLITANPGCLMQLRAGMQARRGAMTVRHLAEVLADAYRQEGDRNE
ncbi:MAG: LUD domain-containing protein [Thermaerobacter sp.]|nr:LUD domain-containing protein [Thermaerobacter sp.]